MRSLTALTLGALLAACSGLGREDAPSPLADGSRFSPMVSHPYLPLFTMRLTELRSSDERVVREVLDETRTIAGVECLVLIEREYQDGALAEISHNFFAQDPVGNVWYFGEDVDEYDNGQIVGHSGSWRVGRETGEPALFMPARPAVGLAFKPEDAPPVAEEWAQVESLDATLRVPAGLYAGVLVILETDRRGKWQERKYYARGVGLISENRELNLVAVGPAEAGRR